MNNICGFQFLKNVFVAEFFLLYYLIHSGNVLEQSLPLFTWDKREPFET